MSKALSDSSEKVYAVVEFAPGLNPADMDRLAAQSGARLLSSPDLLPNDRMAEATPDPSRMRCEMYRSVARDLSGVVRPVFRAFRCEVVQRAVILSDAAADEITTGMAAGLRSSKSRLADLEHQQATVRSFPSTDS